MNLVVIKGNLTRDPELRYLPNGTAVCGFGLAVNRKWKDQNGEQKEEVSFFDVEAWSGRAETVAQWFKKGKPILVQGRLKQEQWEDKETGNPRSKVKIVMDSFDFCGDSKKDGGGDEQPARPAARSQRGSRAEAPQPDAEDGGFQDDAKDNAPF